MMKLSNLTVLIFFCFFQFSFSQVTEVQSKFYGGTNLTEGFRSIETSDNGFLLFGTESYMDINNTNDQWLIKLDEQGNKEWEYLEDYGGAGFFDFAFDGIEVSDGYIFTGHFTDDTFINAFTNITKVDFEGNLVWSKVLDNYLNAGYGSIIKLENDGFIIGGERQTSAEAYDISLAKFDSNGNELWNKTYPELGSGFTFYFYSSLTQTTDGGILFASILDTPVLMKTNLEGDLIWQVDLEVIGGATSVVEYSDATIGVLTTKSFYNNPSVDYLFHIDASGNMLNQHEFDSDMIPASAAAVVDEDDNLYVVGNHFVNDTGLLLKTDNLGDTLWTHTFSAPDSLAGLLINGLTLTSNKQLVITGAGTAPGVVNHFYVAIVTLEGDITSSNFISADQTNSIFKTYPNPADEVVHFETEFEIEKDCTLQLFDIQGRNVLEKTIRNSSFSIYRNDLTAGKYFYIVADKHTIVDKGKIIFK